jgi:PEP-CTERM motif
MFNPSTPFKRPFTRHTRQALAALCLLSSLGAAQAALVSVRVSFTNVAPANGIAFAPLHVGFGQGIFDAFNAGSAATAPIISVAEGGSGSAWQPAFMAAEPLAARGIVGAGAPVLAGVTRSLDLVVDTAVHRFFTFGAMVIPSNDHFIGNDNPNEYQVFDVAGRLLIADIAQTAAEIWDAGSETTDPAAAAFVGNNSLRTPQNGVVNFNFSELSAYNGLTTGAGYVFNNNVSANTQIARINFQVLNANVPEPTSVALALAALGALGFTRRNNKAAEPKAAL